MVRYCLSYATLILKNSQANEAQGARGGRYQTVVNSERRPRASCERGAQLTCSFLAHSSNIKTFWRVLMAFSRTGSTDCMIPSLLSISLIYGCIHSIAFIFLATSTSGCPSSSLLRILAVRAFWMFLMA